MVSRGRSPSPPVAHAGGLSGWSGGQSGETPEPPCCSRRRSKRVVRWSVGGDPRTPLLLTQKISAGGQVVSRGRPPGPLLLTLGVSAGGLSSSAAASSGASGGFDAAPSTF